MSVGDEPVECPLCMEPLEIDDVNFFPCTCGYQICRFCWHRIRTDENGLCPACRKQYPEDPAEFKPLTDDELQNIRKERKQKECQRKQKAAENRKHLANVRVVQKNLVFVVGLSPRLADPEVLKKHDYFGKFGKIHKVVINQSTSYAGSQGPSASAYVTYIRLEDALRAILAVNNVHVDGRTLKTSLGTTKYCSHFLRGSQCMKSDCMYLHELGEEAASFTKEEMQMGKHQEYEQKLIEQFLNAQNSANNHVSNNKIQNRKKSNSPSAQQQINQQHSPPLSELGALGNNKLPQLLTPAVQQGSNASNDSLQTANSPSEAWPSLLPGIGGNTSGTGKQDCLTNYNRSASSNSLNIRTTPPSGKTFGNGRHRSASENQQSQDNVGSDDDSTSGSPVSHQTEPAFIENQANSSSFLLSATSSQNQGLLSPADDSALQLPQSPPPLHMSLPLSLSQPIVMPIGTNRRLSGFPPAANSVSFFSNNIGSGKVAVPHSVQSQERTDSLPPSEMSDSILVSSSTDWSEAFGFKSKETTDDDLGFDPCAESFKGLADLIEKENGQNGQWNQGLAGSLSQEQQHVFAGHLSQHLPSSLGLLQSSQHSLPPGFSLSHIQQQQLHQHLFRPDLGANRMMDFQPYSARPRFPSVHNNFHHSGHDISPNLTHHHIPHSGSLPQTQLEFFNMKDMQEQLRSLLPNINISFGSPPQPLPPPGVTHTLPAIVQNGSDVSWVTNDPAILGLRPFREDAPHWLKSIHQLTESDSPVQNHSRLPFVQQFPIGPAASWPPQTQNPPPGFRNPVRPPAAEPHKLAEALQ